MSYRAREEHTRIGRWLDAVRTCAVWSPALAVEVGRAGQLVKGYGDVRRRMLALHTQILDATLAAGRLESRGAADFAVSTALAARLRALVLSGPDGEGQVPAVAAAALARLEAGDVRGALEPISAR
jgi:hypothetical protein